MFSTKNSLSLFVLLIAAQPCWAQVQCYDWAKQRAQPLPSGNPQMAAMAGAMQRIGDAANQVQTSLQQQRATASAELAAAEKQAAQIRTEGEQRVAQMRNSYVTVKGVKTPKYTEDDIAETQARYENQAYYILARAPRISNEAIKRQETLIESAENLREQLIQKPAGCDSVMLQPVGTNLYVRNYQSIGEQYNRMPHVQPERAVPQLGTYPTRDSSSVLSGRLLKPALK
jgi:hypothetical protein